LKFPRDFSRVVKFIVGAILVIALIGANTNPD